MWVVPSPQTTSSELDEVITHRHESRPSHLAGSSTSFPSVKSDILSRYFERYIAHIEVVTREMLERIESGVIRSFTGSADFSTPLVDDFSTYLDAIRAKNEVERVFSLATYIDLEPGMTNEFSEGLEQVIERYGSMALDVIERHILNEETASCVAMEALKYIGNTDSNVWRNERRQMLETCLLHSGSVWARDGAGLGLSFLGDPRSISALERAIVQETSQALKRDLKQVLRRLKESTSES